MSLALKRLLSFRFLLMKFVKKKKKNPAGCDFNFFSVYHKQTIFAFAGNTMSFVTLCLKLIFMTTPTVQQMSVSISINDKRRA